MFEILTLSQTRKLDRSIPVLLYGSDYWKALIDFPSLARHGMIDREDLSLFRFVDTPAQAMSLLRRKLGRGDHVAAPAIAKSVTPLERRKASARRS